MYFNFFLISFSLSILFSFVFRFLALRFRVVDRPDKSRKFHKKETALLGGFAIYFSFFITLFLGFDNVLVGNLNARHWLGFFIGASFLMLGGFLDDKYNLKPRFQIIFPILAVLSIIFGGVNIEKISNPLGGIIQVSSLFSFLIIFIWLFLIMYSTKLLDGVDGLVAGVGTIGAFIIFLFTNTEKYYQGDISFASFLLFASILGFAFLNFYPAKIFLGEGGSLFIGYSLGVLSIISGAKIAIALLIMGLPLLDLFWVVIQRLKNKENPFKIADRKHLHFKLIDKGLSAPQTVFIFYFFALFFGVSALFFQSKGKIMLFLALVFLMFLVLVYIQKSKTLLFYKKIVNKFLSLWNLFFGVFQKKDFRLNSRGFYINRFLKFYLLFLWYLFILVLISFPMPEYPGKELSSYDKFVHAFLFGVFYFLMFSFLQTFQSLKARTIYFWSLFVSVFYSFFCEWLQIYVPGRDASDLDFFAGIVGILFVFLLKKLKTNQSPS